MNMQEVMNELESLGTERTKKRYLSEGAREPVFGVAAGAMKPMAKAIKKDQALAEELYRTGNYDAMYFAGVIADPSAMTEADFDRWIDAAYFYMIADFVVAVTLSEADIAQTVADKWIASGDELRMSAGWSCYCWLLGSRKDEEFDAEKLDGMLRLVERTIREAPERAKHAMANFVYTTAVSYTPLHERALETAESTAPVETGQGPAKRKVLQTAENIRKAAEKGQLGFKRKHVRC
ncbi:DNA alkylation repair protein [Saccharibacillus alkalitolerans]|uniref:DNA alkylation repair protein n=1 Tax=Saccharibacillus alkalitolerans TaxID=2705290 RepID=A0ABX0F4F2_9BACL|nr:DNA alkylation repair protein [Saccharibacillus alkalitolerans]NGZ75253.1 DNA alkylation repair protein [Saccharibacillus alkalitolerans]